MSRTLMSVAAFGLGIGAVLIGVSAVLEGGRFQFPGMDDADQKIVSRDFAWNGGDSVDIDMPATVRLVPGTTPHVTIRATADALQRIHVQDGVIDMSDSPSFWRHDHVDVTLVGMTLRDVSLEGAGKIMLGHLDQDRLSVRMSGAGEAEADGRVDNLDATISGTGDARFGRLMAKTASVTISGVGNAEINASDRAEVTLSGVGNARLMTQPKKLIKHVSGVGHVESPGEDTDTVGG